MASVSPLDPAKDVQSEAREVDYNIMKEQY